MSFKINNPLPILPKGTIVVEKPPNIDFLKNIKGKWTTTIEALKVLDPSQCIKIEVNNCSENQILSIKHGIRHSAKSNNFRAKIRFVLNDDVLYVWADK